MYTYTLRDAAGRLVAEHVRKDDPDGTKAYFWRLPDKPEGEWGLDGMPLADLPLYGAQLVADYDPDDLIILAEGEKARDALDEVGLPAVGTVTGAGGTPGPASLEVLSGRRVVVWPDNDDPGRKHMARVAEALHGVAADVLIYTWDEAAGKGDDAADHPAVVGGDPGAVDRLLTDLEGAPRWQPEWPEPVAVEVRLPSVISFDPALLPSPLRAWVKDVSERMDNAPPDFAAAAAVVVAAALLGRKLGMRPKKQDDWTVIPNLWGGLVGPPASMKTPSLEQVIKPIKRLAAEAHEAHQEALKEHDLDLMVGEAERTALKKKLESTAKKVASGTASRDDLTEVRQEIEGLEELEAPTERRYLTNDATIEKLAEILRDNPDGILYYRDELMGLLRSLDKAGREADRAFHLEAWNGNGSFSVDRIGRGSLHVPAVCLSILGGIQPGPLTGYVRDALEEASKADGLLQRFQVLVYPDLRSYDPVDRWPDTAAKNRALEVFKGLASLDVEKLGAVADEEGEVPYLRFDDEGQEVFDGWRAEFEPRFRGEDRPAAIQSHFMKYRSVFASLALLFEAVDFVGGDEGAGSVRKPSALRAAAWCTYLESHAMRVYAPIADTTMLAARTLLERIEMGDVADGVRVRDVYNRQWAGLGTREKLAKAIEKLEEHGWVRLEKVQPPGGGRPSEVLHIHPDLRG